MFSFLSLSVYADDSFSFPSLTPQPGNYFPFSNLIAFGDSLSDVGNAPGQTPVDQGNIYLNYLAQDLGLNISPSGNGGYDYAYFDANTGALPFTPPSKPAPTMQQQVNNYLASTGGKADPNGLYVVWGGANDIKDAAEYLLSDPTNHALTLISASTGNIVSMTQQLHNAGANYIIVPNLPDLGQTPDVRWEGATIYQEATLLSNNYNAQLLSSLNATGNKIIQVDIMGLLNALQTNYQRFGFIGPYSSYKYIFVIFGTPVTLDCGSQSAFICSNDPNQDIFYDGYHPSEATNKIGADLIFSMLQGPGFAAMLAEAPLSVMDTQNQQIQSQLLGVQTGATKVALHTWRVFATGVHNETKYHSTFLLQPSYTQDGNGFTVGADYRLNPNTLLGFALGRSMGKINYAHDAGGFDLNENIISFFGAYQFLENAYVDGSISYGNIDFDSIHRNFMLGGVPEMLGGSATGQQYAAFAQTGYNFNFLDNALKTGPLATIDAQRVVVNPYAETSSQFETSNGAFDGLQYNKQTNDSLLGALGWQASYATHINTVTVVPYIQATYNHQFLNTTNNVEAGVTTLSGSVFSLPVKYPDIDFGLVNAGVQTVFANGVALTFGYSNTFGEPDIKSQLFTISASVPL